MDNFTIVSAAREYPILPYQQIKDDILGKKYAVSLAFIGTERAKSFNVTYRKKGYIPNVLSFPLTEDVGEIFITPIIARKEAHKFNMTPEGYIGFLFVHACLHLQGLDHGKIMEKAEKKYCKKYKLK